MTNLAFALKMHEFRHLCFCMTVLTTNEAWHIKLYNFIKCLILPTQDVLINFIIF